MMTFKQKQVYDFIVDYIKRNKISPTSSEIAQGIGIRSRGVIHRYVSALQAKGFLELIPNRRRNIRLVTSNKSTYGMALPILGSIAAGAPLEAISEDQYFDFSQNIFSDNCFLLKVHGDSMIGDNICDGDLIICEKNSSVNNNDIVIALVDHSEVTLKRYRKNTNGTVTLIASNPEVRPLTLEADRVSIQGRYLGLVRLS